MWGFSEGYALKNVILIKLENGQLANIITFNICKLFLYMANCARSIGRLLPGTVKQNVRVQGMMHPVKVLSCGRGGGLWWLLASCCKENVFGVGLYACFDTTFSSCVTPCCCTMRDYFWAFYVLSLKNVS